MHIGQHIELTAQVSALGHTAYPGDQGVVKGIHTDGLLTVRMDNGRTQFPHRDEVDVLDDAR